jgi:Uma2 family endonuclease
MTALRNRRMTASQFLDWTASQASKRFELERGEVIEMAAEQAQHALMKFAAAKALEHGIKHAGLPCSIFPDGMTVVIDEYHVRLPDAAVQCAPVDPRSTILSSPVVLVEVVSPSSGSRDENLKLVEYFSLSSVEHYLILDPGQRIVIHFQRNRPATTLTTRILSSGQIELSPPGFLVTVEDLLGPVFRAAE